MTRVPVTPASLRRFMSDPRYWDAGHPERAAFTGWVTQGFRALYRGNSHAKPDGVWVSPYDRVREGRLEHVSGYWRTARLSTDDGTEAQDEPGPPTNDAPQDDRETDNENIIPIARRRDQPYQQPTLSEGGPSRAGGGARPSVGGGSRSLPPDLEEVLRPLEERSSPHSNNEVRTGAGNLQQRQADFERLTIPGTVRHVPEKNLSTGQMPGGYQVTIRGSEVSGSGPTLEISLPRSIAPGSRTLRKYRYSDE